MGNPIILMEVTSINGNALTTAENMAFVVDQIGRIVASGTGSEIEYRSPQAKPSTYIVSQTPTEIAALASSSTPTQEIESVTAAITAFAGGGQASATQLTTTINNVTVCATAGDSVKLPEAVTGLEVVVKNNGATALDIFPSSADSIDGLAINLAIRIQPGSVVNFFAKSGVVWESNVDASFTLVAPTTNKGQLELKAADSAGNTVTTIVNASQAAARTYTIPDAGASASFVMTAGAQSIAGIQTFTDTTASTTKDTGGVIFQGGIGVEKEIYAGLSINAGTYVTSGDGTVGLPAIGPVSDPDSGLYVIGANNLGVACNGAKVLDIGTSGLSVTGYNTGLNKVVANSTVGANAISVPAVNTSYAITAAGVSSMTIVDPTATTHDGLRLTFIATTANAHTLSNAAGSGFNDGGAGSDIGTFGGAKGDNIVIEAYQGKWYVVSKVNVTLA